MSKYKRPIRTVRRSEWKWPKEPPQLKSAQDRATARAAQIAQALREGIVDNAALRRAVIENPDEDAPRHAYAAWMRGQEHELSQAIGAFLTAQLRVADEFRNNPRADVTALRSWDGSPAFVSIVDFRAGDSLRPWFRNELSGLLTEGIVGWPQVYRGFVERVSMRGVRFLELADELFDLAPIRHLVLIGVPEVAGELAASPHLARIRSLSLPCYGVSDAITDDMLARLLASPHMANLVHLRLVQQRALSPRAYEGVVGGLPRLSNFEIYRSVARWAVPVEQTYEPRGPFERQGARDTQERVARPNDWIAALEQRVGYQPCVHPEEHYGRDVVDIEAVVAHPIALDPSVMARRGEPVPGTGPASERPQ